MGNVTIWNGVNAKNLATDYSFSATGFDGMLVGNQLTHNASTGIISGGVLSINADTTKFDLSAGTGQVINYTTPTNPSVIKVSWSALTAQTVTGLAVQDETYIMIDSAGVMSQQSNFPTPTERRAKIFIGRIGHSSRTLINFATSFPDYGQSVGSQMFDLYDALGPFNISGNQISNNGANLGFQKSAGSLFFRSFNYPANPQTPHVSTIASATPVSFFYRDRDSVFTPAVTVIDPTTYDVAGVQTTVPNPGATATIQRVYLAPNGTTQVQYGQTTYANLTAAIAAIGTDPFIINPALVNTSVLIGYIVVQKNCLSLADTATSAILRAPKFETGVGGGVNSVISLQQAYNSSTQPQIILTSGQGGVQVFDNATPIGTSLYQVANNAGTTNYFNVLATGITTNNPISSGLAGTSLGTYNLSGNTSGTISIKPQAAAGTFNFNLPITAGTAGQVLTSQGGGATAMTWSTLNGAGAIPIHWIEAADAPIDGTDLNCRSYRYQDAITQNLYALIKVPAGYIAGNQIKLRITPYSKDTASTTMLIKSVATLIRVGITALDATTNQRTSTNTAISVSAATVNIPQAAVLDLTDTAGAINSQAVAAGDLIQIALFRDFANDTSTADVYVPVYAAEASFNG